MIRTGELVFIDTGAWAALAFTRDPLHSRAVEQWGLLQSAGAKLHTSVPVILETFTFLDRNSVRQVALAWKDSLAAISRLRIVDVRGSDLAKAWTYFERKELHKLSAVDATSFALMNDRRIRYAFTFDHHFVTAGFRLIS
jgi:uncharacterized protein